MMSTLRWSLLILGVLFIAAREWWEWRRPRQGSAARSERASTMPEGVEAARLREATEPARLRDSAASARPREELPGGGSAEPPLELPEIHAREPIAAWRPPLVGVADGPPQPGAAGSPGAQDDSIEVAAGQDPPPGDAAAAPALAEDALAAEALAEEATTGQEPPPAGRVAPLPRDVLPELPAAAPPVVEWPPDEQRRIVALRLVATHSERFGGRSVRQALAAEGFVLGRFAIFHKPDDEHRAVLSAASLTRPGTFDPDTMDSQHYGGLSLFAVLPGPKPPPEAFEELVTTARSLNERLCGVLQDEGGTPLTPARIASLRQRLSAGASS
jgi:cell division protein ZipA